MTLEPLLGSTALYRAYVSWEGLDCVAERGSRALRDVLARYKVPVSRLEGSGVQD